MFDFALIIKYNRTVTMRETEIEMKQKGSNISTIKAENNRLILNRIRKNPCSRAEIAKATGLSKSAVSIITKQLIDEGLIIETGTESTEQGRHPITLSIVKEHRYSLGISLRRNEIAVSVVDLGLECVAKMSREASFFKTADEALLWCCESGFKLLDELGIGQEKCIGIGVSAPGPLDYENGVILAPPNFELFNNFDVRAFIRTVTDMPVYLNNAPVLMALYENAKRSEDIKNYIFIVVDNGVGSAIIQNGSVFRGSRGFSGEIGHMTVNVNGPECTCKNRGCLEGYITRSAIKKHYGKSYEELLDAALSGERESAECIEEIARYFSGGIIGAVNLLDLEAVIILGELNYKCEHLFSIIRKNVCEGSIISRAHSVEIMPSIIEDENDTAYTAAAVVEKYFAQIC